MPPSCAQLTFLAIFSVPSVPDTLEPVICFSPILKPDFSTLNTANAAPMYGRACVTGARAEPICEPIEADKPEPIPAPVAVRVPEPDIPPPSDAKKSDPILAPSPSIPAPSDPAKFVPKFMKLENKLPIPLTILPAVPAALAPEALAAKGFNRLAPNDAIG